jgi:hypothetical protein
MYLPMHASCPAHLILLDVITWLRVKITDLRMMHFPPESNYFTLAHTVYFQTNSVFGIHLSSMNKSQIYVHVKQRA